MPDGGNSIVVKVNNLCPDDGNPLCAQAESELFFPFSVSMTRLVFFSQRAPLEVAIRLERLKGCEDY